MQAESGYSTELNTPGVPKGSKALFIEEGAARSLACVCFPLSMEENDDRPNHSGVLRNPTLPKKKADQKTGLLKTGRLHETGIRTSNGSDPDAAQ